MKVEHLACVKGHGERIWSVAWSPVNDLFATCSSDCSVKIWRLRLRKTPGHDRAHLCSSADSRCCYKYEITLEASIDSYFKKTVRSVRFNSTGDLLLCASFDGTTSIWTPEKKGNLEVKSESAEGTCSISSGIHKWKCVGLLEGHENEVKCAAFDCTSTYVATCGRDKTVWIHQRTHLSGDTLSDISKLPRGSLNNSIEYFCAAILTGHKQDVKCVCWSPKALVLASSSYDDTVRIWGLSKEDWVCVQILSIHTSTVWAISFDVDGQKLAAVSADTALSVYKSQKAEEYLDTLRELQDHTPSTSAWLKLGPIDASIPQKIARITKRVQEHQLKNPLIADDWEPCHFIQSYHSRPIYSVDMHSLILTGGGDNMVRIMSPEDDSASSTHSFRAHSSDVNGVAWKHNDSNNIFATVGDDEYIKVWKVSGH